MELTVTPDACNSDLTRLVLGLATGKCGGMYALKTEIAPYFRASALIFVAASYPERSDGTAKFYAFYLNQLDHFSAKDNGTS
jgi:hypothetical protein